MIVFFTQIETLTYLQINLNELAPFWVTNVYKLNFLRVFNLDKSLSWQKLLK